MLTLHTTVSGIKKLLKWLTILTVSLVLITVLFRIGKNIKEYFYPTPLPPATVSFGKLTKVEFPPNIIVVKDFTYTLDNVSGTLPTFSDKINVYKIIQLQPNLLALKNAQDLVSRIGFSGEGIALSNTLYQWDDKENLQRRLTYDILSFNFNLSSDYLANPIVIAGKNLPGEKGSVSKAESFLESLSSFPLDFNIEKTKTTLLSVKNSEILPATSLSTTQLIRVDFFQKDVDGLPIFYPNPLHSTVHFFIAGGNYDAQVVSANFFHQNISELSATYPIKTNEQVFEELKQGKAYIASYSGNDKEILLKKIYLAYYLSEEKQNYLMPIIVFEGNNNFYAYIHAIKDEWFNSEK